LVADYQAGASTLALMKRYGIGKGTVLRLLDSHDVTRRHQPMTEQEAEQAVRLYGQGRSLAQVGEQLGRSGSAVWLALKRAGVERRGTHERSA
jgi:transposase